MGYDDTANLRKPGILANSERYAKEEVGAKPISMKRKPLKAKKKSRKRPGKP